MGDDLPSEETVLRTDGFLAYALAYAFDMKHIVIENKSSIRESGLRAALCGKMVSQPGKVAQQESSALGICRICLNIADSTYMRVPGPN